MRKGNIISRSVFDLKNIDFDKIHENFDQDDWVRLITTHTDRHNDYIEIFFKRDGVGNYHISDDGYIYNEIANSGCFDDIEKAIDEINQLTTRTGIEFFADTKEFYCLCKDRDLLKEKVIILVSAMSAINKTINKIIEHDQNEKIYNP